MPEIPIAEFVFIDPHDSDYVVIELLVPPVYHRFRVKRVHGPEHIKRYVEALATAGLGHLRDA